MYGHQSAALLPASVPQFFTRARGALLWDADGAEYIDYLCAYGPSLLGYAFGPVEEAAARQQASGDAMTGPSPVMVELAEALVSMVSHADWAMFCKNGSDATSMAVMVARAATGRSKILCAENTYHGAAAWSTPRLAGTLPEDRAHIVYYRHHDPDSLRGALQRHAGDVAGVMATSFRHETFRDQEPAPAEFAWAARRLCDEYGALLILDDVRAGFRLARDSSWEVLGVRPDLSAWGKCIANGHAISALLGSDTARAGAASIFVTGSFWFAATAMAAGLETLRHIRETDYLEQIALRGARLRQGLDEIAARRGFCLAQTGPPQMPQILFENDPDFRIGYGFTDACIRRGLYLHPFHNMFLSAAHDDGIIDRSLEAADAAMADLATRCTDLEPHPGALARLGLGR
jgi:glutamate-1-semialdehyde 2,1-aminomutase